MHMRNQNLKLASPSAARNRDVICEVLEHILPASGTILEIGSGSGEHAVHFARNLSHLDFQPTEHDQKAMASIESWMQEAKLPNIKHPLHLDLFDEKWPIDKAAAIISINVIHITPWPATIAILKQASTILPPGAPLYFYGPFHRSDVATTQSNLDFDMWLKSQNPASGIRYLDDLATHAQDLGFTGPQIITMPANNLSVVFTKS